MHSFSGFEPLTLLVLLILCLSLTPLRFGLFDISGAIEHWLTSLKRLLLKLVQPWRTNGNFESIPYGSFCLDPETFHLECTLCGQLRFQIMLSTFVQHETFYQADHGIPNALLLQVNRPAVKNCRHHVFQVKSRHLKNQMNYSNAYYYLRVGVCVSFQKFFSPESQVTTSNEFDETFSFKKNTHKKGTDF